MLENLKQSAIERENEKHEKLQFQIARATEVKDQLVKMKQASKVAEEELDREINARNEVESKLESLESEFAAVSSVNKRLQAQIGTLEITLSKSDSILDDRASEYFEMERQCKELESTNQKLSGNMSEARSTINELGRRLAETQVRPHSRK